MVPAAPKIRIKIIPNAFFKRPDSMGLLGRGPTSEIRFFPVLPACVPLITRHCAGKNAQVPEKLHRNYGHYTTKSYADFNFVSIGQQIRSYFRLRDDKRGFIWPNEHLFTG